MKMCVCNIFEQHTCKNFKGSLLQWMTCITIFIYIYGGVVISKSIMSVTHAYTDKSGCQSCRLGHQVCLLFFHTKNNVLDMNIKDGS